MNTLDLEIIDMAHSGHGIAHHPTHGNIFILGTFPGDTVRAELYHSAEGISYAEIVSFISYSSLRNYNPQQKPFFSAQTPWEHLSLEAENMFKTKGVEKLFEKYLDTVQVSPLIFSQEISDTGYRNKVAYSFMQTPGSPQKLCFSLYTRGVGGSKKIPQTHNQLIHPVLESAAKQFLHFFNQHGLTHHDLKYLILRYSYLENKVVAHILVPEYNRKKLPFKKSDIETYIHENKYVKGILVSHSHGDIRSAMTTKDFFHVGDRDIHEQVLEKTYSYHPSLFFQIYPRAFEDILRDIRKLIETIPNHTTLPALDLFAGVGIIGIEIADLVSQVLGVEISPLSEQYAYRNAQQNKIKNYHFKEKSVDTISDEITDTQIVLVDPTRTGLSNEIIHVIHKKLPAYIFYISCNPETQFKDFEKLSNYYSLEFIKAYNIFPKTHHTESIIMLQRRT